MKTIILAMLALGISALVPVMRAADKGAEPDVISHGAKVTLAGNLVAGKITVFDFSEAGRGQSEHCNKICLKND